MKGMHVAMNVFVAVCTVLCIYVYGVRSLERVGLEAYHRMIVRNMVVDKSTIMNEPGFRLGLYRPELPYQFGMLWSIQQHLGVRASIVSYYQAWGDGGEYGFKSDINRNLHAGGYTPLITWEPWVAGFSAHKGVRVDSSLMLITRGDFDSYIRTWARQAVVYGKPLFLRPGHEMSNAWYSWSVQQGNTPQLFKQFWCHVHGIFQEEGARNVAFVWNPYTPADTACYPGDEFVDWIGLDIFNFGSLSESGIWMDFYTVTKILYDAVKGYNKPVMIAEVGCVSGGGNKMNWYRDMFHYLAVRNFPLVRALVLFDTPHATSPTGLPVDLGFATEDGTLPAVNTIELTDSLKIPPFTLQKE